MLSKDKRLNLKKDFKWVVAGKRAETELFKIYFRAGENTTPLVGISLSKKYLNKAHDRNRARRLVAHAIELFYADLPNNLNLIIMPKQGILSTETEKVVKEFQDVKDRNFSN